MPPQARALSNSPPAPIPEQSPPPQGSPHAQNTCRCVQSVSSPCYWGIWPCRWAASRTFAGLLRLLMLRSFRVWWIWVDGLHTSHNWKMLSFWRLRSAARRACSALFGEGSYGRRVCKRPCCISGTEWWSTPRYRNSPSGGSAHRHWRCGSGRWCCGAGSCVPCGGWGACTWGWSRAGSRPAWTSS